MNRFSLFLLSCLVLSVNVLYAQNLTREERRTLERELKDLQRNPERFKAMKEEDQRLTREINAKKPNLANALDQFNEYQATFRQKEESIRQLREDVRRNSNRLTSSADLSQGVVFRVQIGSYKSTRLIKQLQASDSFFIEDSPQGTKRYMVGAFSSYWEAKYFVEELTRKGGQAFVVGYLEGKRIENLKEMPEKYF